MRFVIDLETNKFNYYLKKFVTIIRRILFEFLFFGIKRDQKFVKNSDYYFVFFLKIDRHW